MLGQPELFGINANDSDDGPDDSGIDDSGERGGRDDEDWPSRAGGYKGRRLEDIVQEAVSSQIKCKLLFKLLPSYIISLQ